MLYKLNNGLGKIRIGWTERTIKREGSNNFDRVREYIRHNPDTTLEDIITFGNKYDEQYLHKHLDEYRISIDDAGHEWYDGTDPVAKKEINKVWFECKKRVAERVALENEIYRENHPEIFND